MNTISKMKNAHSSFNSRLDGTEDQINGLEDKITVSTEVEH